MSTECNLFCGVAYEPKPLDSPVPGYDPKPVGSVFSVLLFPRWFLCLIILSDKVAPDCLFVSEHRETVGGAIH